MAEQHGRFGGPPVHSCDWPTCARRCPKCSRSALPVRDRDRGPQHFIVGFIGGLVVGFLLPIGFFGWVPFS